MTNRTSPGGGIAAASIAGAIAAATLVLASSCSSHPASAEERAAASREYAQLAHEILQFTFATQPTQATYLGVHDWDDKLENWSREVIEAEIRVLKEYRRRLNWIAPDSLALADELDRQQLLHAIDSRLLTQEVIRPWATNADVYASGATNAAYILIKRAFAPPEERLRKLIAREKAMPRAFDEGRKNLVHPPRILTQIALEQVDGNRDFLASAVPAAFAEVKDAALLAEFKQANDAVLTAFDGWKKWLQDDLLPRSDGDFALGAETYRKKLQADEMVDLPLDELLRIAQADLAKNQAAFELTAKAIDPAHSPAEVLAALQLDHPAPGELLATTQRELDSIAKFITDKRILTIPQAAPARVQETPPFLRATTSASMDTPGPFERVATEAYYSMTLPDPAWDAAATGEFMKQWYYAAITNVSVHEVWPGHYLQFLNAPRFPSDVRKVFSAATNVEGWAHYCEQMMVDEGLNAGKPKWRLAQLQDALLRDARFVVGIKMHTQGMTVDAAKEFFEREAWQPEPVAISEAKRGTSDPTYGYYTLGKLMIQRLRDDLRAQRGSAFTLQQFHDEFLALGPLPLPLIRRALLGEAGRPL